MSKEKILEKRGELKKHLLTHTTEKPHVLKTCNKRFLERDNLNNHLRKHTVEIRPACEVFNN